MLARQLIMVLGGSSKLSQHLIAHPEHLDLLERRADRDAGRPSCAAAC